MARQRTAGRKARVLVLVGTRKGIFIFESDGGREKWKAHEPTQVGWQAYHVVGDRRNGSPRLFAACTGWFGNDVFYSDDIGKTWQAPQRGAKFAEDRGATVKAPWHVAPGRANEPGVVYVGVEPAALFRSEDGGVNYEEIPSLYDHPSREKHWNPGGGGLCLHTIVLDPSDNDRMYVAISTAGVFRTADGGRTWEPANSGTLATFLPDTKPDVGQCVHKMVLHPANPQRLYQQNHCGVYRSDDGGTKWKDIGKGLPSTFGFPIAVHPADPNMVFVIPTDSPEKRWLCDGKPAVYRSTDAGKTWERCASGLPQKSAYLNVLREGMAADGADPAGVYFGATNGQVYCSTNKGRSWRMVAENLPYVLSVHALTLN